MTDETPRETAAKIQSTILKQIDQKIRELEKDKADIYRRYPELIPGGQPQER